ncbi:MAG TPA: protein-glutamate O-methyltransferase CheR [Aromatoleum sp.]|uniref:CheR family methyltransferase n=1 Tax=Aromatoleum sp. TaxID=2307007 RepID=UPI002B4781FC|nr:protein-glutamate O-methyltransferase CheR [Aromatoleum sp.]HJV24367.1 protein-glutamate O-methyltransferase CheR [Aromatoleum sp.]
MNAALLEPPAARGLSDAEFTQFQKLLHRLAGIHLAPEKKALVCGRLNKRLRHYGLASYGEYLRLLASGREAQEVQTAVDLLTTNETYFFREPKHFALLRDRILPARRAGAPFRIWSAACSSGEEPYSLAMLLADCLGDAPWDIVASDISTRVLAQARTGHYAIERADNIPGPYLKAFCLKGVGPQDGSFLIERSLRSRIDFRQVNLNERLPQLGSFDVIFLRNVMIYFDVATKREVVQRLLGALRPGGHLIVGHSESLNGISDHVQPVAPSVYRKP